MPTKPLKAVSVIHSVFFDGQSKKQITSTYGCRLELVDNIFIKAIPPPAKNKSAVMIPMSNVSDFVELDVEAEEVKRLEVESKNFKALEKQPKPAPLKGVSKFVKDETTGEIVEKKL